MMVDLKNLIEDIIEDGKTICNEYTDFKDKKESEKSLDLLLNKLSLIYYNNKKDFDKEYEYNTHKIIADEVVKELRVENLIDKEESDINECIIYSADVINLISEKIEYNYNYIQPDFVNENSDFWKSYFKIEEYIDEYIDEYIIKQKDKL